MSARRLAFLIVLVIVLWVASGQIIRFGDEAPEEAGSEEEPLASVRVMLSEAEEHTQTVTLNAVTEPNRSVSMRAEIESQVIEILAQEGMQVEEGQVLIRMDVRDRDRAVKEAEALLEQRRIEYKAAKALKASGFQSRVALARSKAELEQAEVNLIRAKEALERTMIYAPFDGVLQSIDVELGDVMRAFETRPMATVVDIDPLLAVGHASERVISDLKLGAKAMVRFVDGREVEGVITYISAVSDDVTRTFRVEVSIPNPTYGYPAGVTAFMYVPVGKAPAHFVPASALTLDKDGEVGVKVLKQAEPYQESEDYDVVGEVTFVPINILLSGRDGVWLTGLPEEIHVITLGQQFVSAGQRVKGQVK